MEGSPVRGQDKSRLSRLNASADIQSFQSNLLEVIRAEFPYTPFFFAVPEQNSQELGLPPWIRTYLERHPGLLDKLEQGETAGIDNSTQPFPRPATAARSRVILVPMMYEGKLQAVVGIEAPLEKPPVSAETIEAIRQLANEAASIMARLQSIDRLVNERNSLLALLEMQSHLQANAAHELRTPLAAIRGYVRMIVDGRGGEINDTQKDYLRVVTENTNRLINVVNWVSHVAELTAQDFNLTTFDLRDVWAGALQSYEQVLAEKSVVLAQKIPDEPFGIIGDREKLTYVFNELIATVLKLSIPASPVAVEFSHGRERGISFKISVQGANIPTETMSRIFERSFGGTVNPVSSVSDDPSRISLFGAYDVIGMHGGRLFVNSGLGQGSTFLFTLPAITIAGEDESNEQAVHSGRRRR